MSKSPSIALNLTSGLALSRSLMLFAFWIIFFTILAAAVWLSVDKIKKTSGPHPKITVVVDRDAKRDLYILEGKDKNQIPATSKGQKATSRIQIKAVLGKQFKGKIKKGNTTSNMMK